MTMVFFIKLAKSGAFCGNFFSFIGPLLCLFKIYVHVPKQYFESTCNTDDHCLKQFIKVNHIDQIIYVQISLNTFEISIYKAEQENISFFHVHNVWQATYKYQILSSTGRFLGTERHSLNQIDNTRLDENIIIRFSIRNQYPKIKTF